MEARWPSRRRRSRARTAPFRAAMPVHSCRPMALRALNSSRSGDKGEIQRRAEIYQSLKVFRASVPLSLFRMPIKAQAGPRKIKRL